MLLQPEKANISGLNLHELYEIFLKLDIPCLERNDDREYKFFNDLLVDREITKDCIYIAK